MGLERALEDSGCRIEVEDLGFALEDEGVEYEEEEESSQQNIPSYPSSPPAVPSISNASLHSTSLPLNCPAGYSFLAPSTSKPRSCKMSRKTASARRKRATAARARDAAAKLKKHVVHVAQDSTLIELKMFDISSLCAGSNGCRIVVLDSKNRILAALGGVLPRSVGGEWNSSAEQAKQAVEDSRQQSTFSKAQQQSRRGDFAFRTIGFRYGNRR
ncbi:hypothetical protein LENED_000608 [Lentinula edodes]|uniref:Uncharacterized protein n=1 Tax=Lentinula edodes TaxID=5353 RepID=A0A1Q3DW51_LENED|nr:hypothetical protein LENED_000608 [Lentinula edodes]